MKTFLFFAALFGLSAAPALAGDGQISRSNLSRMGLAGMNAMTDTEGTSIRGTSFGSFTFVSGKAPAISVKSSGGAPVSVFTIRVNGGLAAGGFASATSH